MMMDIPKASSGMSRSELHGIMPIVWINGWPGVGKHTISKLLKAKLEDVLEVDTKVVHNHHHIDLASAIVDRSETELWQKIRKGLRTTYLDALSDPQTFKHLYILTDFQTSNELGLSVYKEIMFAAKARHCLLIPVVLTCSSAENIRRITSPDRVKAVSQGKGMLIDAERLKKMKETYQDGLVGDWGTDDFRRSDDIDEELQEARNTLMLDVSELQAEDSADEVARWICKVMERGRIAREGKGLLVTERIFEERKLPSLVVGDFSGARPYRVSGHSE